MVTYYWYESHSHDDQIATGRGPGGVAPGPGGAAGARVPVQPPGLHPAPALRGPGPQDVLPDRLPRRRAALARLRRTPPGSRAGESPALLHALLRRAAAAKKGEFVVLL